MHSVKVEMGHVTVTGEDAEVTIDNPKQAKSAIRALVAYLRDHDIATNVQEGDIYFSPMEQRD